MFLSRTEMTRCVDRWLAPEIITALLTISLERSVSSFFGDGGFAIVAVVFPGILGSIALAGNAHAFSLLVAAGINLIFYFISVWAICGVSRRTLRRFFR
jgi:hypothetical protein